MEEWRHIKGYDGLYLISSTGKVYSCRNKCMLSASLTGSGYLKVQLCKDSDSKQKMIHRLVAETFIPNPERKKTVNHIDGNKLNNDVSNLEWNTYSENLKHAYKHGLNYWCEGKGRDFRKVCMIDQYTGEILKTYDSIGEAYKENNLFSHSTIIEICKFKRETAGGYVWRYAENPRYIEDYKRFLEMIKVSEKNTSGKEAYKEYCRIVSCKECEMSQKHFYKLLKHYGIMKSSGTIKGKTERNVLVGREIAT
jgi:hypothetical protein